MRIWDVSVNKLCRQHLLGEHAELHCLFSIISNKKKGFANHPETKRWRGKLAALYKRHEQQIKEMKKRGYNHQTPLDKRKAKGKSRQTVLKDSIPKQKKLLRERCGCGS